jgi:hypothetical protein
MPAITQTQWVTSKRNEVNQKIQGTETFLNSQFGTATATSKTSMYDNLKSINVELSDTLTNYYKEPSTQMQLREIARLQQQNMSLRKTAADKKEELSLAEARLESIQTRHEKPSYAQTIGYIFRPFRRISYIIIVPLIFAMILASVWLLKPGQMPGFMPTVSAAKVGVSNFNRQIAELGKLT